MTKKVKIKKTKVDESIFTLTGDKALLLAEGCKLNKQKKEAEKRLKEIKKSLDLKVAGQYTNSAGDKLNFTVVSNLTDPEPEDFYKEMKKKKLKAFFWKCIKVSITEAKKYLTEKEMNKLRAPLDPTQKYSFL